MHQRNDPKDVIFQRTCRLARNEKEVRELLEAIWENTAKSEEILNKVAEKNKYVYEFEKVLEESV